MQIDARWKGWMDGGMVAGSKWRCGEMIEEGEVLVGGMLWEAGRVEREIMRG